MGLLTELIQTAILFTIYLPLSEAHQIIVPACKQAGARFLHMFFAFGSVIALAVLVDLVMRNNVYKL